MPIMPARLDPLLVQLAIIFNPPVRSLANSQSLPPPCFQHPLDPATTSNKAFVRSGPSSSAHVPRLLWSLSLSEQSFSHRPTCTSPFRAPPVASSKKRPPSNLECNSVLTFSLTVNLALQRCSEEEKGQKEFQAAPTERRGGVDQLCRYCANHIVVCRVQLMSLAVVQYY